MNPPEMQNAITVEWLVEKTAAVYSLPLSYERLTGVINHPRSSIADIAKVIIEDQGLTARLLKLANSPMFGYFSKIDSVSKALMIIGMQQLRDLTLAVSVMELFSGIPKDLISMRSFWQHSLGCGIIARALAVHLREANVERYFATGILHDIGRLVLCTILPDTVLEMLLVSRENESLLYQSEASLLGFTHAAVGGAILERWNIPAAIVEPVSHHHDPGSAGHYPLETAVIHLADIVCNALQFGCSGERYVPPLNPAAWDRLNISAAALSAIVRQVQQQITETFAIFEKGDV